MTTEERAAKALDLHLTQQKEVAEGLREQLSNQSNLASLIQKANPGANQWRTTAQEISAGLRAFHEEYREHLKCTVDAIQVMMAYVPIQVRVAYVPEVSTLWKAPEFQKVLQESVSAFREGLAALPEKTREAVLLLAHHGWYVDDDMSFEGLSRLKKALIAGNAHEAESALAEFYEGKLAKIEDSVSSKFPHRRHLIRSALNAHRRGEFDLSIPVLLAQADGICNETVGKYLFIKENKKPGTAFYVEQLVADAFSIALLSPLTVSLPIDASKADRPNGFSFLNRHTVLHGESLDYGTRENSLKAISLVNYVASALPHGNA